MLTLVGSILCAFVVGYITAGLVIRRALRRKGMLDAYMDDRDVQDKVGFSG